MSGNQEQYDDVLLFYKDLIEAIPLRYGDQRETIESETLSLLDIATKYIPMFIAHWYNKDQKTMTKFFSSPI